ncbi:MAG: di-trans,poly-cis-decaprenylcistransferase, partial [Rhodobacteraceae bacterium]|nr:di-trans,poly-cis-decaprenylcistransferase [Paracoccaceae bacterium]
WKRPSDEVSDLMQLLKHYLQQELDTMHQNGVRMRFIGDLTQLGGDVRGLVDEATEMTARNTAFNFTVALSYGARQEIVRAARKLAQEVADGKRDAASISEDAFALALDTGDLPEPDLLIRTGGEHRLSNFLLWQSAYTEFYFTDVLWPDFDTSHFENALQDFAKRERRYGTSQ